MRRLTYSPKAYIFIRSSNMGGKIYDVSADVVRGSVTQNCDDVSKAEFELRNRFKKWIKDSGSEDHQGTKRSIFLPMDLVTIWLQRLPGHPIQCFTGYLDSVPYYQGYPGNAPFTATCTLKKLAFTWFDPGLTFFANWLNQNGWAYVPSSGQAINPEGFPVGDVRGTNLKDGGFSKLLGQFMVDVALWDPSDVLVSDLPPNLPKSAAKLYRTLALEANEELTALSDFFGAAMGVKGWNGTGGKALSHKNVSSRSTEILQKMRKSATKYNVPVTVLAWAAYVMTNFDETYSRDQSSGDQWGYGIYALRPDKFSSPAGLSLPELFTKTIDGISIKQVMDAGVESNILCKRLNKHQGAWVNGARNDDVDAIKTWVSKAIGRSLPDVDPIAAFNAAKKFGATSVVVVPIENNMPIIDPNSLTWTSAALTDLLTAQEKQLVRNYYRNSKPWLAARLYQAKYFDSTLRPAQFTGRRNDQLALASNDTQLLHDYANALSVFEDQGLTVEVITPDSVNTIPNPSNGISLSTGFRVQTGSGGTQTVGSAVIITEASKPTASAVSVLKKPDPAVQAARGGVAGGATWEQMAAFSAVSAFSSNFAFPTDVILSNALTGEKALMNDMSCLDAVKQFAQASLRSFRSLPDGRFLAFYPDYFGAYRDPYWSIENIELVNFGIVLNDEQLATHVYITGDTVIPDREITLPEQIGTMGVASITQGGMVHSFIEPWDPDSKKSGLEGQLADVYKFLQHYGARPYSEEQPIIRSTVYEFLLAWQRFMQKWASQFATTAEFTFQPEVMAGGLIKFPDHGVQMYCESVTHHFDYAAGFSTTAVLSAPSIPKGSKPSLYHPGFALAGSVNTVGE